MSRHPIIQQQHEIFRSLQSIVNTDTRLRSEAEARLKSEEASAEKEKTRERKRIADKLNAVMGIKAEVDNKMTGEWRSQIAGGTAQSTYLLSTHVDFDKEWGACQSSAERAQHEVLRLLQKYETPGSTGKAPGCWGAVAAVVLWIIIGAAVPYGQGWGIGFIFALIAFVLIWLLGAESGRSPLKENYGTLRNMVARAQEIHDRQLVPVEERYQQRLAQARNAYNDEIKRLDALLPVELTRLQPDFQAFTSKAGAAGNHWAHPDWSNWQPAQTSTLITRIGTFTSRAELIPTVPAFVACPGSQNILIEASGGQKNKAIEAVQSLMLRLLATQPPGKVLFTLIDPIGLGQNVATFMQLADQYEKLVNSRVWSETKHIEQQLSDLTEHMGYIIQKYLRGQYSTIEEYNQKAGEVAEPYRVLVVTGFPVKFSQDAARRLVEIATNGPKCGVSTIVMMDTEQALPYDFNLKDLERVSTVIAWDGHRFAWKHKDFEDNPFAFDSPPPLDLINRILKGVGEEARRASDVKVPFARVSPLQEEWWTGSTREDLRVPLGRAGATNLQYFELGKGMSQHALVVGKTGSGKTTLLHVLLTNLALTYSPDELELYLIDFKTVGFTPYATFKLPHARVVATKSEREFGISVLQGLDAQLEQRKKLFSNAGVQDITQYRTNNPEVRMPRILLLVDEFQEFFTEDDRLSQEATLLLDRLVRQGRAFGMHVMLGSQTLAGAYTLARSTIGQMAVRIALQCEEADSRLIFSDDNPDARLLSRSGEAIYNAKNGQVSGNSPFQCAWLPEEELQANLESILAYAQQRNVTLPWEQIFFEGDADAHVEKNKQLRAVLLQPYPFETPRKVPVWVGDPIAIKDPTAVQFFAQAGNNLLMLGMQDEAALGMQITSLLSLAAHYPPERLRCYAIDFTPLDLPHAGRLEAVKQLLPHRIQIVPRRKLQAAITEISDELADRKEADRAGDTAIYLLIYGLQRVRDLRPDEDALYSSFGETAAPPSLSKQFATILRDGPELGIHTIAWCDTYSNLNRSLERGALREFEMRLVFQVSSEDSMNLVDSPAASKLGLHRTLFYSEETGRIEKFIPYGLPSEQWLNEAAQRIQQKSTATAHQ